MVLWVREPWWSGESVSWGLWRAAVGDQRQQLWRRCGLGAGWVELAGGRDPARGRRPARAVAVAGAEALSEGVE